MDERVTPDHDDDAERALLGAMLISAPAVAKALELVTPDQLYRPYHRLIWSTIVDHDQWGDQVLIHAELLNSGDLRKLPTATYLVDCVRACTTPANVDYYAQIVVTCAQHRGRATTAERLRQAVHDPETWQRVLADAATESAHEPNQPLPLPPGRVPQPATLRQRLANPLPPVAWRIRDWQPAGARVVLAAQYKAGKTTLVGNLLRCLADAQPWLGHHKVEPVNGKIVLLDFEMGERQLDTWLADQRITRDDQIVILPLRGYASTFNLTDPTIRDWWAGLLRDHGCAYLIWDCLRPVIDATGLDEHHDAGRLLTAFDALLAAANIPEATVVHHMGHTGERSRGDSRLRDWPDIEWRLVRQDDDPSSPRYLTAYGRDVDIPETLLHHDPTTRHLTINGGGTRQDSAIRACLDDILELLADQPGLSGRNIEATIAKTTDHTQKAIRAALKTGTRDGWITATAGGRRAILYTLPAPPNDP